MSHLSDVRRAMLEIPSEPAWLRNAGITAVVDYADYTDEAVLSAVIGRQILPDEHAEVVRKCDMDIRRPSEVLRSMGLIGSAYPFEGDTAILRGEE